MSKEKLLPFSIICLSISILISAVIIFQGLKISSRNSSDKMSNALIAIKNSLSVNEERDIMNEMEAANYLGISLEEFTKAINNEELKMPSAYIANQYIFSKKALEKWLETNPRSRSNDNN